MAAFPSPFRMTPSTYKTTDFFLASYLLDQGAILAGHQRVSPRGVVFRFASDERLHELLRLYWRGVPLPLVPIRIFAAFRRLKSLTRARP
jgi:hypothetical protein